MRISRRIIGIDPGSESSGIVLLDYSNIQCSFNLSNAQLYEKITSWLIYPDVTVVVEDLAAYTLRLTPQVISTAKFIGEFLYRLRIESGANVILIQRSDIKLWCFQSFYDIVDPIISAKIDQKLYEACSMETREVVRVDNRGKGARKGSFIYIDDKCVTECMKHLYKIPLPLPGKGYQFGLQTHSWQALAVASCYIKRQSCGIVPVQMSQ